MAARPRACPPGAASSEPAQQTPLGVTVKTSMSCPFVGRMCGCLALLLFELFAAAQQTATPPAQLLSLADQSARAAETAATEAEQFSTDARLARERAVAEYDKVAEAYRQLRVANRKDPTLDATVETARTHLVAARKAADRALAASPEGAERLEIFPFLGFAVDTFSGDALRYLNPEDVGDSNTRETFGVSFQYPLHGGNTSKIGVWLYGQTLHGVRSTEIDCTQSAAVLQNPNCQSGSSNTSTQNAIYLLRSASSLEGTIGLRVEFLPIQRGNAALYISKQAGFVAVEDDDDDVADVNHLAIGARIRDGRFRNSYIEYGEGSNDLFTTNPDGRKKLNARVVARFVNDAPSNATENLFSRGFFFAHITADVDGSGGGDAVQSFVGMAFCPWGSGKCGAN
jgi:hypothetical protein